MDFSDLVAFLFVGEGLVLGLEIVNWILLLLLLLFLGTVTTSILSINIFIWILRVRIVTLFDWLRIVFRSVWVGEETVVGPAVHQDTNGFEAEEGRKSFPHLSEEALVVPLGTDLTGKLEGVDDLLFSLLNFLQSMSPFQPHLKIEAHNFKNLFVSRLKP